MIDPELLAKLDEIGAKADQAFRAAESVRKYLFWTGVVTVAFIVIPLIGLVFAIPMFMHNYLDPLNSAAGNTTSIVDLMSSLGL